MRGSEPTTDHPPGSGLPPCATADPTLWFAEHPADLSRAKAICAGCPLRVSCLAGALDRREPWGVWGGEIVEHGVVLAYKRGRGRPSNADRRLGLVTRAAEGERRTGPQERTRPWADPRREATVTELRPAPDAAVTTRGTAGTSRSA